MPCWKLGSCCDFDFNLFIEFIYLNSSIHVSVLCFNF